MEKARLLFVDNLRILLITLVIVVHLSVTYGGVGEWYYKEGRPDTISFAVLTWNNGVNQAFFMGFLFMMAGYFTPGSYDRKGPWGFLRDRLLRLGIPMLFYDFVINPLIEYMLVTRVHGFDGSVRKLIAQYFGEFHIGTGPLWFVETLLIFAIIYVLWRHLTKKTTAPAVENCGKMFGNRVVVVLALALGIVSFIVRIWLPIGWGFAPLNLQFPFFPQYICLFIVGIVAYRRNWLTRIDDAMGRLWLCVALVLIVILFPALFVLGGALTGDTDSFTGGLHWQCLAYALWEQSLCMAMIITLLLLFRRRLNRQGKLAKAMSASAYTAYIIHAPIVVLVTLAIRNITLYPLLKFALTGLVCVPLCFALGNVVRKLPLARRIL